MGFTINSTQRNIVTLITQNDSALTAGNQTPSSFAQTGRGESTEAGAWIPNYTGTGGAAAWTISGDGNSATFLRNGADTGVDHQAVMQINIGTLTDFNVIMTRFKITGIAGGSAIDSICQYPQGSQETITYSAGDGTHVVRAHGDNSANTIIEIGLSSFASLAQRQAITGFVISDVQVSLGESLTDVDELINNAIDLKSNRRLPMGAAANTVKTTAAGTSSGFGAVVTDGATGSEGAENQRHIAFIGDSFTARGGGLAYPLTWRMNKHNSLELDSGTATGGSTLTVIDMGQSWTTDEFTGAIVRLTNDGAYATVVSNTSDTLTVRRFVSGTANTCVNGEGYIIGDINYVYNLDGQASRSMGGAGTIADPDNRDLITPLLYNDFAFTCDNALFTRPWAFCNQMCINDFNLNNRTFLEMQEKVLLWAQVANEQGAWFIQTDCTPFNASAGRQTEIDLFKAWLATLTPEADGIIPVFTYASLGTVGGDVDILNPPWQDDSVHPNELGYEAMRPAFYEAFAKIPAYRPSRAIGAAFAGNTITLSGAGTVTTTTGSLVTKTYTRGYIVSDSDARARAEFTNVTISAGFITSTTGTFYGNILGNQGALTLLDETGKIATVSLDAVLEA